MESIEITDPAFRFGLGAFETILVRNGKPHFSQWHWENLCEAANVLGVTQPQDALLKKLLSGDGMWRWFATSRGTYDFFETSIPAIPDSVQVDVSDLRVSSQSWEARYKTMSYLLHYQAKKQSKADETILLNENGIVASASMANVFFLRKGELCTPSQEAGCRKGVIRRWVIESSGMDVREGNWSLEELLDSDEIFLTNSRLGICPVVRCRSTGKKVGEVTQHLRQRYLAELM